jgi:hypothetical protein
MMAHLIISYINNLSYRVCRKINRAFVHRNDIGSGSENNEKVCDKESTESWRIRSSIPS